MMTTGWLICIVCVMLLVIFIVFAENWVHMFRSSTCTRPTTQPCPPHPDTGHCAGDNNLFQKAANVGLVGGAVWGTPIASDSSNPPP